MTATLPALTEAAFMRQVTELAEPLGWEWPIEVAAGSTGPLEQAA